MELSFVYYPTLHYNVVGRIDELWNLETMFSQLAKQSARMLVSSIFKQQGTFIIVPDVLSKVSKIGNFQMKCMMSATFEIIFY